MLHSKQRVYIGAPFHQLAASLGPADSSGSFQGISHSMWCFLPVPRRGCTHRP